MMNKGMKVDKKKQTFCSDGILLKSFLWLLSTVKVKRAFLSISTLYGVASLHLSFILTTVNKSIFNFFYLHFRF